MDILHCDLNNFFASVEQTVNPELMGHPIAVAGNPENRHGIILAKNYAAKNCGVQTGEAIWCAMKKCPNLICVEPHYDYYVHYSKRTKEIYAKYTDQIESFGLDECWLDVTHSKVFGTPEEIAYKIKEEVKKETGLTISVGVSFTKTLAKLGSDLKKPDAVTVLSQENFKEKVWPLPVGNMIYIGRQTEKKLNSMGIFTLGDLANASKNAMERAFGVIGEKIQNCANGIEDDPVSHLDHPRDIKSVSHGTTTLRDMKNYADADHVLFYLSDMVATRLRRYGLKGSVVSVNIRRNDLSNETRQMAVPTTYVTDNIYHASQKLLRSGWKGEDDLPLRTLTVQVGKLVDVGGETQLSLFDEEKQERLEYQLDKIRKKFGFNAVTRASHLNNDLLDDKPISEEDLLPFKRK